MNHIEVIKSALGLVEGVNNKRLPFETLTTAEVLLQKYIDLYTNEPIKARKTIAINSDNLMSKKHLKMVLNKLSKIKPMKDSSITHFGLILGDTISVNDTKNFVTYKGIEVKGYETPFLVGLKQLKDAISKIKDTDIVIEIKDNNTILLNNKITVPINYDNVDIFPILDWAGYAQQSKTILSTATTSAMIKASKCAAEKKSVRSVMTNICFNGQDIAGTDAHILYKHNVGGELMDKNTLIPAASFPFLGDFNRIDVVTKENSSIIVLSGDNFQFASAMANERYPNFHSVIPSQCAHKTVISKKSILDMLSEIPTTKDIATFTLQERYVSVKCVDYDEVSAFSAQIGDYSEGGVTTTIGFKLDYLKKAIELCDLDTITLEYNNTYSACVIRNGEEIILFMPVHIND